jgi:BRCA1-associated protein
LNDALSQCHVCGTTDHNFVCLICGVVSCGGGGTGGPAPPPPRTAAEDQQLLLPSRSLSAQPTVSHARQHYDEHLHAYALDTETQHVWDFAGGGYVHRLLQSKSDGKLVEVNDPSNTTSRERSLAPGLSDAQEGEVVHRKLEGFASQYYTLLKSQLEQQRIYYEGRLEEVRREHSQAGRPRKQTSDLIAALKHERGQLSQRLATLKGRRDKARGDASFLKDMTESLEENRRALRQQLQEAQRNRVDLRLVFESMLPPLQQKVTALMLQLEGHDSDSKPPAV